MTKSSNPNPEKGNPLINLAIIVVLLLTALPIALFALVQIAPPSFGTKTATTAPRGIAKETLCRTSFSP